MFVIFRGEQRCKTVKKRRSATVNVAKCFEEVGNRSIGSSRKSLCFLEVQRWKGIDTAGTKRTGTERKMF